MYWEVLDPEIMKSMVPPDFPADRLSRRQHGVIAEKDVMVTMRDGVRIAVNIYRPDAEGQFPALFAADAYQKDLVYLPAVPIFHMRETNDIDYFVSRGYVYVHMDIRGTGHSVEGEWRYWSREEQNDLYDMVEWIAVQPWCTGKVGTIGESLLAWAQWFTAATAPPHLVCIVPFDGGADMYRDVCYHGGMMAVGFPSAWHFVEIRSHYRVGKYGPDPDLGRWDLAWNIVNHQTCDDFWKTRSADLSNIKCAVFSIGELHKIGLHLRGNIRGYEEAKGPKKLLLCHGEIDGDEMAVFASPELRGIMLRWYDHWLKGNDTGMMDEPPVTVFVRGLDRYRPEKEWPLPGTEYRNLYLAPGHSGSVESLNDGRLSWEAPQAEPGAADSSVTYHYPDPGWLSFAAGGSAVIQKGMVYQTKRILTFTTEPLEQDVEVIGNVVFNLWASSNQTDTDFFVRLVDQWPDEEQVPGMPSKSFIVSRGWLKASHAVTKDDALSKPYRPYYRHDQPQPIEPGAIRKYEIEVWATSNRFQKGHRIRLELASADSPPVDFGGHYYGLKVGDDTIYYDKDRSSHIVLPVIPEREGGMADD
jgi:uncharacterized protein